MARVVTLPPDEPGAPDGLRAAGWWHGDEEGLRLTCDMCPRGCTLEEGKRGFCFVRQNVAGSMVLTTYGRSTGFCIDPIEKKPLNHFYPGTSILSFGTAGCNLGCKFCQNWTSSRSREVDDACDWADPEAIARAARELDCKSVAFTYNDPVVWAEYAVDTAKACRQTGVKTVAVTAGYIAPQSRKWFYDVMDAANVDLKAFTEDFYWKLTSGHLAPVLDTLRWIARESNCWMEITNLVIPQGNDSLDEIRRMCDWIVAELGPDVPLHFSAFHPDFHLRDREPTPLATLLEAYQIARQAGIRYVYTGNLTHPETEATYCPGCGRAVIRRDRYTLSCYDLQGAGCRHCGASIAGHFDARPGTWGARRQPVQIASYAGAAKVSPPVRPPLVQENSPVAEAVSSTQRPQLTQDQEKRIFSAACLRVAAAVSDRGSPALGEVLGDAAQTVVYGAFVTLKRGGQLRSCCGFLGQSVPLAQALDQAAWRAAKDDPRFPPISPSELAHLHVDVWLLWGLVPMTAQGEDRVAAVVIGRHGLQIARGGNRGLLLPGVAVEHKLDSRRFLEQVCLKAGLPPGAWREPDTQLWTFEGYAIEGPIELAGQAQAAEPESRPTKAELAALAGFCHANLRALLTGATPSFYLPDGFDANVAAIALDIGLPGGADPIQVGAISLRDERPLQSSLYQLLEAAARDVRTRRLDPASLGNVTLNLTVLTDPAMHGSAGAPDLEGFDPRRRALLAVERQRIAWIYDPSKPAEQLLAEVLALGRITEREAVGVFSLAAASTAARAAAAYLPQTQAGPETRPAAVAGSFYPADVPQIEKMLGDMVPAEVKPEPWAAVMLPHAGWVYSGRLAAQTLARVRVPEQVIVFCPKHRGGGAAWAVAPHRVWSLPSGQVPADPDLAARLVASITGLELDAVAHRQEHAIEVLLPLLARLAPHARVTGITIGGGELASLKRFGDQLADAIAGMSPRPLLIISSDMNHFDNEERTRKVDRVALEAMQSLDPDKLYETVTRQRISMCGMFPAVIVMQALGKLGALQRCEIVGYTTSAEASGDTSRVVGYAGVLLG